MSELFTCVCVSLFTTVVHNTAHNSSDYLQSYPPDKHQSSDSDAVYWRADGLFLIVLVLWLDVYFITIYYNSLQFYYN